MDVLQWRPLEHMLTCIILSITNEQFPCKLYICSTWVKVVQIYSAVDPVGLNVPSCTWCNIASSNDNKLNIQMFRTTNRFQPNHIFIVLRSGFTKFVQENSLGH